MIKRKTECANLENLQSYHVNSKKACSEENAEGGCGPPTSCQILTWIKGIQVLCISTMGKSPRDLGEQNGFRGQVWNILHEFVTQSYLQLLLLISNSHPRHFSLGSSGHRCDSGHCSRGHKCRPCCHQLPTGANSAHAKNAREIEAQHFHPNFKGCIQKTWGPTQRLVAGAEPSLKQY